MGTLKAISTTFLVLLSLLLNSRCCEGKRICYVCDSVTQGDLCFFNPDLINTTETYTSTKRPCKHYCTIKREEFMNISRDILIRTVKRDCEESPLILDGVIADPETATFTYYRSCRANLCNGGDGLQSLKDIPPEEDEEEEDETNGGQNSFGQEEGFMTPKYTRTSIIVFKIYFFHLLASIFSIT